MDKNMESSSEMSIMKKNHFKYFQIMFTILQDQFITSICCLTTLRAGCAAVAEDRRQKRYCEEVSCRMQEWQHQRNQRIFLEGQLPQKEWCFKMWGWIKTYNTIFSYIFIHFWGISPIDNFFWCSAGNWFLTKSREDVRLLQVYSRSGNHES